MSKSKTADSSATTVVVVLVNTHNADLIYAQRPSSPMKKKIHGLKNPCRYPQSQGPIPIQSTWGWIGNVTLGRGLRLGFFNPKNYVSLDPHSN